MTAEDVRTVMAEAGRCALVMLENASYIERELPYVRLPDDLRAQISDLCSSLTSTKHDVFSELFELDEILAASTVDASIIASRIERIVRWLSEDLPRMHELVMALRASSDRDVQYTGACVLVTESAANILRAFDWVRSAVDHIQSDPGPH